VEKDLGKRIANRAKSVLAARNYERFEQCIEQIDRPMANALRTQIAKLDTLGRVVKEDLLNRLRARFPLQDAKPEVAPWAREDRLYVTEHGLSRKQAEIDHHVNVKMKENARAIGTAAEHGDLSENSEYKFALEERDLLRAMLAQMNNEMAMAVVLAPEDVPTDHVGVGTRAVFRRVDGGQTYEVGLVGPWDTDPKQSLLNYKSPLAQRLMGKRIGDIVEFAHADVVGEFELTELHNALESSTDPEA
jgi:transcription elongation GreA/GreB family factor